MNKKIALLNCTITEDIKKYFKGKEVEIFEVENLENSDNYNIIVTDDYRGVLPDNAVNIHPSLLPAFDEENAIEKAFLYGVKVSGITLYSNNGIIAQYPVLIGVGTHIDDLIYLINEVKKRLVPPVIEAVINDRVFDVEDLFTGSCSKSCGGCGGCH